MKGLISFSLFIVIAIIVWWSVTEDYSARHQFQQASDKPYVDIFMNEFELTAMDDSGAPGYILRGSHLQQFNNADDTLIKQPVFHLLQANAQWIISADNAILNNKKQTIQLNNNVLMQQQNSEPAVNIRTQSLLVHTQTQIVQTQVAVNITQGRSRIKSKGMIFNNITNELELSPNVNSVLFPYE
jgi:lipopolysaccharide export system protein LptC